MKKYSAVLDKLFVTNKNLVRFKKTVLLKEARLALMKKTGDTTSFHISYGPLRAMQSLLIDTLYKKKHDSFKNFSDHDMNIYCQKNFSINYTDIDEKWRNSDFFAEFEEMDLSLIKKQIFENFVAQFHNLSLASKQLKINIIKLIELTIKESNLISNMGYQTPKFDTFAELFLVSYNSVEQIKKVSDINDKAFLLKMYLLAKMANDIEVEDSVK